MDTNVELSAVKDSWGQDHIDLFDSDQMESDLSVIYDDFEESIEDGSERCR